MKRLTRRFALCLKNTGNEASLIPGKRFPLVGDLQPACFDRVDLSRSVVREVEEETGLTDAQLFAVPGWVTIFDRQRVALTRIMQSSETTELSDGCELLWACSS